MVRSDVSCEKLERKLARKTLIFQNLARKTLIFINAHHDDDDAS